MLKFLVVFNQNDYPFYFSFVVLVLSYHFVDYSIADSVLKLFHFPVPFGELMMYVVLPQALCNGFVGAAFVLALAWAQALRGRFEGGRS